MRDFKVFLERYIDSNLEKWQLDILDKFEDGNGIPLFIQYPRTRLRLMRRCALIEKLKGHVASSIIVDEHRELT